MPQTSQLVDVNHVACVDTRQAVPYHAVPFLLRECGRQATWFHSLRARHPHDEGKRPLNVLSSENWTGLGDASSFLELNQKKMKKSRGTP